MNIVNALICSFIYIIDLLLLVPKYTRCSYDHTPRKKKLMWKGACIGLPLLILIVESVIRFSLGRLDIANLIIVFGMALCAIGDIILEIRFIRGGFLFFFGHAMYIVALIMLQPDFKVLTIIIYVLVVAIGTILTITKLGKKYRFLLIMYNAAISGSFALAVTLILSFSPANVLLGAGAAFLGISDWLLARNKTYKSSYTWSLTALLFYFGGQMLISTYPLAMSLLG